MSDGHGEVASAGSSAGVPADEPVLAVVRFDLDRDYYRDFVEDWHRHKVRWRRFEVFVGLLLLAVSMWALMHHAESTSRTLALVGLGFGVSLSVDGLTYKWFWVRKRCRSGAAPSATFTLTPTRLLSETEHSRGAVGHDGWQEIVHGDLGLFLAPSQGVSIFLPWARFDPPEGAAKVREALPPRKR